MAKKIILFLSLLSEDESKRKTKDYACAAGVLGMDEAHEITGTQTNEAPVKAAGTSGCPVDHLYRNAAGKEKHAGFFQNAYSGVRTRKADPITGRYL